MKQFILAAVLLCGVAVHARPYVMVPLEEYESMMAALEQPELVRVARSPFPDEEDGPRFAPKQKLRKRVVQKMVDDEENQGFAASQPQMSLFRPEMMDRAGSDDSAFAGSAPHAYSHKGNDYVDYGAYTGGYGAFGWYTDHPVLLYGHGHH